MVLKLPNCSQDVKHFGPRATDKLSLFFRQLFPYFSDFQFSALPSSVENKITRMLTSESLSTAQLLRRPLQPRKQFLRKRSRSMNSIKHLKGETKSL